MKLILRIIVNAVALWVTALVIPSINLSTNIIQILIVAIIFGLVNAFIRPIVKLLTLPISVVTLGLFTIVINALMLMLTAWLVDALSIDAGGFIQNFLIAILGSVLISIVSMVLSWFLPDDK
jgi:putative membrane protein